MRNRVEELHAGRVKQVETSTRDKRERKDLQGSDLQGSEISRDVWFEDGDTDKKNH